MKLKKLFCGSSLGERLIGVFDVKKCSEDDDLRRRRGGSKKALIDEEFFELIVCWSAASPHSRFPLSVHSNTNHWLITHANTIYDACTRRYQPSIAFCCSFAPVVNNSIASMQLRLREFCLHLRC